MRRGFRISFLHGLNAKILTVPAAAFCLGILVPGTMGYMLLQQSAITKEKLNAILRRRASPAGESRSRGRYRGIHIFRAREG